MPHAEAVEHLRTRRAAPDAPLQHAEYTLLQTHVARVLQDKAGAEWRRCMIDALQALTAGRDGEPSEWAMRIDRVMTATPIPEEDLADLQVEFGHPLALPPGSAAEARREVALSEIKAALVKLLGTDDGEDYWLATVVPALGKTLHPREVDRVITRQRDAQTRLTLAGARIRMANTLRDAVMAEAMELGVAAALTADWQADHLDPAVEAVQTGRSTRRVALNGLLRRLRELAPTSRLASSPPGAALCPRSHGSTSR